MHTFRFVFEANDLNVNYLDFKLAGVLPVQLVSFEAQQTAPKNVRLTWNVASQSGIIAYEVQRSTDGKNFSTIATIPATEQENYSYQYDDGTPAGDKIYYRIKIIEPDRSSFSKMAEVNYRSTVDNRKIVPATCSQQRNTVNSTTYNC